MASLLLLLCRLLLLRGILSPPLLGGPLLSPPPPPPLLVAPEISPEEGGRGKEESEWVSRCEECGADIEKTATVRIGEIISRAVNENEGSYTTVKEKGGGKKKEWPSARFSVSSGRGGRSDLPAPVIELW